jgi:hypothetical protein
MKAASQGDSQRMSDRFRNKRNVSPLRRQAMHWLVRRFLNGAAKVRNVVA